MCKVLSVTESGFYRWLRTSAKPTKRELLLVELKDIIGEAPENQNYGIKRIQTQSQNCLPSTLDSPVKND